MNYTLWALLRIISIIMLIQGLLIFLTGYNFVKGQGFIKTKFDLNIFLIGIALFILTNLLKSKIKRPIEHTKCPKCKETFNYKDTLNGKCPHCKDVETIDIKEYYEKFPDEKKE